MRTFHGFSSINKFKGKLKNHELNAKNQLFLLFADGIRPEETTT